jgi:hypothetical protein
MTPLESLARRLAISLGLDAEDLCDRQEIVRFLRMAADDREKELMTKLIAGMPDALQKFDAFMERKR